MVRKKLAAAIAALGALQADVAGALGLGEFSLHSALNQPLHAEIRLLNTSDLDNAQVRIALADSNDFKSAGVSRDFFLTNLKFSVEMDGKGSGVIKVTTREAVIEPYLDFLIEARWPSGRLLREYTVLLDLPVFSESAGQQLDAATSNTQAGTASTRAPAVSSTRRAAATRQASVQGRLTAGEQYRVGTNDTLWEIASQSRPVAEVSVQKTMLGIQRLNPHAFINGNINRLKAGSVLRLPKADEMGSISDRDAVGEVASQNRAWRSGQDGSTSTSGAQLDATANSSNSDAGSVEQPRLSIATGGESDRASAGDGSAASASGTQALQNELNESQESLDKSQLENEELQSRLNDMETRMATLQRLLEVKDDQLAALQGTMASEQEAPSDTAEPETAEPMAAESTVEPDVAAVEKPEQPVKPAPVPAPAEPELLDQLLGNPLYAGGAGLLVLALVILLLRRRKAAEEEGEIDTDDSFELAELEEESDELLADIALDQGIDDIDLAEKQEELDATDLLVAELEQELSADVSDALPDALPAGEETEALIQPAAAPPVSSTMQSETGDAIAEADIYVAYGRYQQAIDLLSSAIAQEPQRSDLQVKLLEVTIETRDKPGFQQQYIALQALGDEAAVAQVKEMLSTVEGVADWLDDLPGTATDFSDADMDADLIDRDSEVDLDDELEIDLDLDAMGTTQEVAAISLDQGIVDLNDDLDLDFDLDDDALELADETQELGGVDVDLDLDLDLDELATENSFELPKEESTDEGFDLDLEGDSDLDLAMDELDNTDLSDLEAEFGEIEGGLGDDLDAELDLSEPEPADDEAALNIDLDSLEFDTGEDLSADSDTVEFSTEAAAQPVQDESFDEVSTTASGEDFDFLADTDEVATKLDLARAYIDMGDTEGARDILAEVVQEGSDEQKQEATELMERAE